MRAYDIIVKKRNGEELSTEEIDFLVGGYTQGRIPDAQMAAWLMAVYFQGMTSRETADLTMAMVRSGRTLDLSSIPGIKVDKHSTGGVGDKTTLVLIPVLAAAGVPAVKMAGRSLGYTGGTIDKLESIPGFDAALSPERMIEQVKRIGAAIACQTMELAPADKKMYALRDLTATVESIPLIAASVMSKKIAAGADAIVLDVKAGSGAFMHDVGSAAELAQAMIEIGTHVGRRTVAAITDMDQPLGRAVGNALEVREAIETLHGRGPSDLVDLCAILGGMAIVLGGKAQSMEDGEHLVRALISDGRAAAKLRELIAAQGGDARVVDDPSLLPQAPIVHPVRATESGYVSRLDALTIAQAEASLGAGRGVGNAAPDLSVGIYLHKKIGGHVNDGDLLAEIHASSDGSIADAEDPVRAAYTFTPEPPLPRPLVARILGFEE